MGVDRYWEAQDELRQCPAKLAAANAKIVELERELADHRTATSESARLLHAANTERSDLLADVIRLNNENHALRAAKRADEERIKDVVMLAFLALVSPDDMVEPHFRNNTAGCIASRVASQLAGSVGGLSESDRESLLYCQELVIALPPWTTTSSDPIVIAHVQRCDKIRALLDRLLGVRS